MKICTACKNNYPRSEFNKNKSLPDGLHSHCKSCRKKYRKNNKAITAQKAAQKRIASYGITQEQYDKMLEDQNGCCAICLKPETAKTRGGRVRKLAVDHCHETGLVRGLLCAKCNIGLGYFYDDIENLQRAMEYLN